MRTNYSRLVIELMLDAKTIGTKADSDSFINKVREILTKGNGKLVEEKAKQLYHVIKTADLQNLPQKQLARVVSNLASIAHGVSMAGGLTRMEREKIMGEIKAHKEGIRELASSRRGSNNC